MRNRIDAFRMRHKRVRKKIAGTAACPRMSIKVTSRYMYIQFIDDGEGKTLASASSIKMDGGNNTAVAKTLGETAAKCAADAGIREVVVDRGGHRYQGRVRAIVEAVAAVGLVRGVKPPPAAAADEEKEEDSK